MKREPEKTNVRERLNDREGMSAALNEAASNARRRHIQAGVPLATYRDGRVVHVNPIDLIEITAKSDTA